MEGRAGDQRCRGTRSRKTPQGPTWTWVQGKGDNGEENGCGNDRRRRNAERGAETSGRIWGVVGVDDVQVDGALRRERRWGVGVHIGVTTTNV